MAVRQGALQLRDLHEDTTGPDQGEGWYKGTETEMIVNSIGEHYLQTIPNSLAGADMSLCGDSVNK